MRYDFCCGKCNITFEFEKRMSEPNPACPTCGGFVERAFGKDDIPSVKYANRPPWTYNDVKKYRHVSDGHNSYQMDGTHGSMSSASISPPRKKKKK